MKQYIGTKLIEAEPAYRVDGKVVTLAENKVPCGYKIERGYKVRYADGYESFSPQGVFESAYLPLEVNGMLKTAAPSISAEMVERFIDHHETVTMGGKTTVVRAVLKNGFEIVESSSCVSAENYDEKLGEEICMERIRNKIWKLLGFLLQTAVGGVNGEAVPAIRKGGEVYEKTQPIPRSMEPEEDGYKVRYPDGYESFSPKQVFEEAYRPTDGMSFGLAIEAAKKGMKIARAGWNGKNQHVEPACCISYLTKGGFHVNVNHNAIGNNVLAFVGTSGVQLGWLASQADMLADDWMIVEG